MARILLIDDDDAVRSVLSLALNHFGHTVVEACSGEEGLELVPKVNADLLITDIVMPGKGGLAVLAEMQDKYPAVKVIAISGGARHSEEDSLHLAKSLGAAAVLAKPFSCKALMAVINELLRESGSEAVGILISPGMLHGR